MSDYMTMFSQIINSLQGQGSYPIVNVKSSVDGEIYRVRDLPDKQAAADLLARVRAKIKRLYHSEIS